MKAYDFKVLLEPDQEAGGYVVSCPARPGCYTFIDFSQAQQALMPNLKPALKTISIRLPELLLESIKVLAHKRDVPYQSLMKMLLAEGIERELYAQRE